MTKLREADDEARVRPTVSETEMVKGQNTKTNDKGIEMPKTAARPCPGRGSRTGICPNKRSGIGKNGRLNSYCPECMEHLKR